MTLSGLRPRGRRLASAAIWSRRRPPCQRQSSEDRPWRFWNWFPTFARIDLYAKLNGELKLLDSTSSRGDRLLEGREAAAFYSSRPDTFLGSEKGSHEIFSVQPVRFANGQGGFVTVVSSVEAEQEMLHSHYRILLVALIVATALLGAATTWLFRTTVVDSIRQLVETMERFRRGERRVRVKSGLKGEFNALGKDLNYL